MKEKILKYITKNLFLLLIIIILIVLLFYKTNSSVDIVEKTLQCKQLYTEEWRNIHWASDIGINGVVYNAKYNNCLAYNVYKSDDTSELTVIATEMNKVKNANLLLYQNISVNDNSQRGVFQPTQKQITKCSITYDYLEYRTFFGTKEKFGCDTDTWIQMNKIMCNLGFPGFCLQAGM